jgi:DNA-directed RNA polymerase subunit RPC12/RpoP
MDTNSSNSTEIHSCTWCGKEFELSPAIWVRMVVRIYGEIIRVRGAICTKCRSKLYEVQIAQLKFTD